MARRRGEQRSISHPEPGPSYLPAQHPQLVPEHEQLHIFHIRAAPATNQQTKQNERAFNDLTRRVAAARLTV